MNQLLEKALSIWPTGSIDYCIEDIIDIILDEIYGRLHNEKEEDNLPKKCKEIKSKKGYTNFKIIGSIINFINTTPKVIGIIDK